MKLIQNIYVKYVFPSLFFVVLFLTTFAYSQTELHTPYPIIFVHGLKLDDTTWNEMTKFLGDNGLTWGGRMDFCLNQDNNLSTSLLSTDYKDYTNTTILHTIYKGDFYTVNFDVNYDGKLYINSIQNESNQSAIVKQGKAISDAVKHVIDITGAKKVILVCHSMGGLAAREYLQNKNLWLEPNINHHVAKLVTIGTPHGGSNATDFGVDLGLKIDLSSEAVRDLRTNYYYSYNLPFPANVYAPGTYIFGGVEDLSYMRDQLYHDFHNADVNCDGIVNDEPVTGLNHKFYPKDLTYSCIVGTGDLLGGDGVVKKSSANINNWLNYNGAINADVFILPKTSGSIWHTELTKQIEGILEGLDVPDNSSLTYEIGQNSSIKEFITYQPGNKATDIDLYKLVIKNDGLIKISLSGNSLTGVKSIYLLNSTLDVIKHITDVNETIDESLKAGTYYVHITSIATIDSYKYPYTLTTQFTETPSVILAVSTTSLQYYDVLLNTPKNKTITLTNNGSTNVSISSIALTDTNADQFSVAPLPPLLITPGASLDETVTFNPTSIDLKNATLTINTNATENPSKTIILAGNGVDHSTKVLSSIPSSSYIFDNTKVGQSRNKIITLKNTGSSICTVSDISIEGSNPDNFNIASQPTLPFNIATGDTKQITIQFKPISVGSKNVSLAITNNSDNFSPKLAINLYGDGLGNAYSGTNNILTNYEYWYDNNYNAKTSTAVNSFGDFILDTQFNTDQLIIGLHSLYIRYKDKKGKWSSVISKFFYKLPAGSRKITTTEYWFDDDYTSKIFTSISPSNTTSLNIGLDVNTLPQGLHSYHVRYKDESGKWSSIMSVFFYKLPVGSSKITSYRYWVNNDFSNAVYTDINNPVQILDLSKNINLSTIVDGNYSINFQFKDTKNQWSSVLTKNFTLSTLSIIENTFKKNILVYPNPTNGVVYLDLGSAYGKIDVKFFDANGRIIKEKLLAGIQKFSFDISFPSGIYYMIITAEGKKAIFKIIKY